MSIDRLKGNRPHLQIVTYKDDSSAEGFMIFPGAKQKITSVERTPENDHLFLYNTHERRFEVIRYGSALIVSLLRLHEPEDPSLPTDQQTVTAGRPLVLFDSEGGFHNRLLLAAPLVPSEQKSTEPGVKHTASFLSLDAKTELSLTIPIDDIQIVSLSKIRP